MIFEARMACILGQGSILPVKMQGTALLDLIATCSIVIDSSSRAPRSNAPRGVDVHVVSATVIHEKIVIIGRETMGFAIIGLQSSTSLKRHLKYWHFVLHDIWSF